MFPLKPFQEIAISQLKEKFLTLWKLGDYNLTLTFKSPTGSGKTIMMAQFLRDIVSDPRFSKSDVGFLWITNSDSLAMQSKDKLFQYYGGASENPLLDLNNLSDGAILKNGIFFINWQKLVSRSQTNRKLRTEGELNTTFDQYLNTTHSQGREVILIIDEEHIASSTVLASDLIKNVIKPRIIIGVSATPQTTGVTVEVLRENVVKEGLIKEKIIFQTEEDLNNPEFAHTDQDEILLSLAYEKCNELSAYYKELGINIKPLVLVQLPNDYKGNKDTANVTKQDLIVTFLKERGVLEHEIAVWLSEPKYIALDRSESGHSDGSAIFININDSRSRQLFTWAHEISHSYFGKSSGVTTDCLGVEFHCSGTNLEEERLCDFGASLILMYGMSPKDFCVDSLIETMNKTGASPEAITISMCRQAGVDDGIIVWRRKCKKGENTNQTSLFSEEIQFPFRIDYAYSKNIFLPNNKSIDEGDSIILCETNNRSSGVIGIKLNNNMIKLKSDNLSISNNRVLTLYRKIV